MSSLLFRRILVWGIGMGSGFVVGLLIITFLLPAFSPDPNARAISIQQYGIIYFLTTVVPLGLVFVTVLDRYLDTRILPD